MRGHSLRRWATLASNQRMNPSTKARPLPKDRRDAGANFVYDIRVEQETVNGQPVTDEQIEAWAREAEAGYPVADLRKRGRRPTGDGPGSVVPVRLDAPLLAALAKRAEEDQLSRSDAIRAAIRAWVSTT